MAETVYFLDGTMDVILTDKDAYLERMLREKLGDDVARLFRELVIELQEELEYTKRSAEDYERSADGYLQMCHNAQEALSEIITELNRDRLNRDKLNTLASNAYKDLYTNL